MMRLDDAQSVRSTALPELAGFTAITAVSNGVRVKNVKEGDCPIDSVTPIDCADRCCRDHDMCCKLKRADCDADMENCMDSCDAVCPSNLLTTVGATFMKYTSFGCDYDIFDKGPPSPPPPAGGYSSTLSLSSHLQTFIVDLLEAIFLPLLLRPA